MATTSNSQNRLAAPGRDFRCCEQAYAPRRTAWREETVAAFAWSCFCWFTCV